MKRKKKRQLPTEGSLFLILFFVGFTAGIVWMNVWWRLQAPSVEAGGLYLLSAALNRDFSTREYLFYLIKYRGIWALVLALSGITIFGVPLAVLGTIGAGFVIGGLLTLGLLELGLKGGILALAFLFPQYLIYIPVLLILGRIVYQISLSGWKTMSIPAGLYRRQLVTIIFLTAVYSVGILLENYVNPWIVNILLEKLKIF
ncbi:MAG: stage II sporulation protein M [Blautia sp.]|jgi:stage II sporulation protein M